jgi:hypothetical protein
MAATLMILLCKFTYSFVQNLSACGRKLAPSVRHVWGFAEETYKNQEPVRDVISVMIASRTGKISSSIRRDALCCHLVVNSNVTEISVTGCKETGVWG